MHVDGFRLHRHVGSSGELIVRHARRDPGRTLSGQEAETFHRRHAELFRQLIPSPRPLPGAVQAFRTLGAAGVPHVIATASYRPIIDPSLVGLELPPGAIVVEGKGELHGKPEPDLFLAGPRPARRLHRGLPRRGRRRLRPCRGAAGRPAERRGAEQRVRRGGAVPRRSVPGLPVRRRSAPERGRAGDRAVTTAAAGSANSVCASPVPLTATGKFGCIRSETRPGWPRCAGPSRSAVRSGISADGHHVPRR